MDHFDLHQWIEYVRGAMTPPDKEAMARHLSEGCDSCTQLLALVNRIHEVSREELTVPEHLVNSAKAVFQEHRPVSRASSWLSLPLLPVQLMYTSGAGAVAGTRSALDATVQAVYHAGDYTIDLQIEPGTETSEMALVGQVVNRAESSEPLTGVPVLLTVRNKQVAESQSNRFGEFCLVTREQRGMKLCLEIRNIGKRIEIPLRELMAGRQ